MVNVTKEFIQGVHDNLHLTQGELRRNEICRAFERILKLTDYVDKVFYAELEREKKSKRNRKANRKSSI